MEVPYIINGGHHSDERGRIDFVNDFDMSLVKRLYYTEHFSTDVIRAWQAHIVERRWFLCVQGAFTVKLVGLDSLENPSENLKPSEFNLNSKEPQVLYIPPMYANGFKAEEDNSKLMVFADYGFGINPDDQVRFDKNKWTKW